MEDSKRILALATVYGAAYRAARGVAMTASDARVEADEAMRNFADGATAFFEEVRTRGSGGKG